MILHGREMSEPELKAYIKKLEEMVKIKEHMINDKNTMLVQAKHLLFKALRLYFNRVFLNIAVSALKLSKGEGMCGASPVFGSRKSITLEQKHFV